MDAQRIPEIDNTIDHPLVQVDHEVTPLSRLTVGQRLDERLLVSDGPFALASSGRDGADEMV